MLAKMILGKKLLIYIVSADVKEMILIRKALEATKKKIALVTIISEVITLRSILAK